MFPQGKDMLKPLYVATLRFFMLNVEVFSLFYVKQRDELHLSCFLPLDVSDVCLCE